MNFLKKLFGIKEPKVEFTDEEYEKDYKLKMAGLENILGKSYDMVGHAIIPFQVGGAVDMYYFPNGIKGTGFATMELLNPEGKGPKPNRIGTYELVAFTKNDLEVDETYSNPFGIIERRICRIFTSIGFYSSESKLNPLDTCEVPQDEGEDNICLIFDEYKPDDKEFLVGNRKHCLLLVMEVFRKEMEYARENGTGELIDRLKAKGHYPYSDLNREPVI